MRLVLASFLLGGFAAAPASAQDGGGFAPGEAVLACQASRSVSCAATGCVEEVDEAGLPVSLRIDLATRRGNLCTYTYCRNFALMAAPTAPAQTPGLSGFGQDALNGFTVSAASSSTDSEPQPVIDYALSISRDAERFFLGNIGDGGVSGWSGACALTDIADSEEGAAE